METLLSLGIAMGFFVLIWPAFSNVLLAEKQLKQERVALLACREQVKLAQTEPLESLSLRVDYRLSPYGAKTAIEIINPAIKNLVVLR